MERTDHKPANSRLVGTNSYPLLRAKMEYRVGIPRRATSAKGYVLMAASLLVRHCVICQQEIPAARLQVSPNTITCSPEH